MPNKNELSSKKLKFSFTSTEKHWVGNGFHVHGVIRPSDELNPFISPFLLMDYASPKEFTKTKQRRGVGEHPHRGFETVTFSYRGEVEHRDSAGGGGTIKPGDVQWMTAGSGIIHDEFHSDHFSHQGGLFEMVQLWVNLPKKFKMTPPKYQGINHKEIPKFKLGNSAELRLIAGQFRESHGPASTFTPIHIYDIHSEAQEEEISLRFNEGTNTIVFIMNGEIKVADQNFQKQSVLIFEQEGNSLNFKVSKNFKGLVLNGEPIDEPIFAHGPFVMNSREEISQAIKDFQNGKMGQL